MVCEIISTVERRRRWPDGEKLRIIEEALTSGSSIAAVADRNGVCRSLLYTWLRLARSGRIPGITMAAPTPGSFIPVRIAEPGSEPAEAEIAPDPALQRPAHRSSRSATVEIKLTNGRVVKVEACIEPAVLAGLVAALDGGRQ
jgi:transposase